jgi:hypothetical protein
MKCLTPNEVSVWLRQSGQIENPRDSSEEYAFHFTFKAPLNYNYQALECFWNCIITEVAVADELLIMTTDAEPSVPSQDFILEAVRRTANEKRLLFEAPGYSVSYDEREKAVALLSLMSGFGWKCYLYPSQGRTVFYNWEGELFDFWTDSESKKNITLQIIKNFGLSLNE